MVFKYCLKIGYIPNERAVFTDYNIFLRSTGRCYGTLFSGLSITVNWYCRFRQSFTAGHNAMQKGEKKSPR
jgi:hypothetical protein